MDLGLQAGVVGFEPTDVAVKVLCLTAWRYPFLFFGDFSKRLISYFC